MDHAYKKLSYHRDSAVCASLRRSISLVKNIYIILYLVPFPSYRTVLVIFSLRQGVPLFNAFILIYSYLFIYLFIYFIYLFILIYSFIISILTISS